jgi:hypothetical protein
LPARLTLKGPGNISGKMVRRVAAHMALAAFSSSRPAGGRLA